MAVLALVGCLAILAGCEEADSEVPLTGRIVYVVSNDVQEYDLVTGKRRELFRDDGLLGSPITAIDRTSFIVSGGLIGDSFGMLLVDGDGQAHQLGRGHSQVFFPAKGKLLYMRKPAQAAHIHLYEATLLENRLQSPRVVGDEPISFYPMLPISDNELLVRRDRGPYMKYDLRTGMFEDLPIEKCVAAAWRSRTREVICVDESTKVRGYALVGLDGRRRPVPGLKGLSVAVYVPAGDYVLAGRARWSWSRGGEVTDLYSYDFSTGAVRRIAKGVTVGSGRNAFWAPARRDAE